jgi:hypothetical protein
MTHVGLLESLRSPPATEQGQRPVQEICQYSSLTPTSLRGGAIHRRVDSGNGEWRKAKRKPEAWKAEEDEGGMSVRMQVRQHGLRLLEGRAIDGNECAVLVERHGVRAIDLKLVIVGVQAIVPQQP